MKVEITESKHINAWYHNEVVEQFCVEPYKKDDAFWQLVEQDEPHLTKLIKKSECKRVEG